MLMFLFLLSVLSISEVCLKPIGNDSELTTTNKEDESRSKRQVTFFDLLHQAIEKYVKCAAEHLAPLKALPSYEQYEALISGKYFPINNVVVGASQSNPNKSQAKCTKVNLCAVTEKNSLSERNDNSSPLHLSKALDTNINILKLLPYFSTNGKDKSEQPPQKHGSSYSPINNFNIEDFLNIFPNKSTAASRKPILKSIKPETILGGPLAKTSSSVEENACFCLGNNRTESISNRPTNNAKLQSSKKQENGVDFNRCLCGDDKNASPSELEKFGQNLNQLLMQLDLMVEEAGSGELRQIVEKIKNFKSAFDSNFESADHSSITTPIPSLVGAQVSQQTPKFVGNAPHQLSFSNLGMELLNAMRKANSAKKLIQITNRPTTTTKITSNKGNVFESKANMKTIHSNICGNPHGGHTEDDTNAKDSSLLGKEISFSFPQAHALKDSSYQISEDLPETVTENSARGKNFHKSDNQAKSQEFVGISRTPAFKLNISDSQNLKRIADNIRTLVANLNDFVGQESIEPLTRSPVLRLAYKKPSPKCESLEENITGSSTSTRPFKILNKQNQKKDTYSKQPKGNYASNKIAQGPLVSKANENSQTAISDARTNSSQNKKKDSKIIISITSNGNFKNINVQQHVPDDKKLEINEQENINMDSHAEPILSEIYPAKSKSAVKPSLNYYSHKTIKQPSKHGRDPNSVWQTFQSSDVFDCGNRDQESLATNSKRITKNQDTQDAKSPSNEFT